MPRKAKKKKTPAINKEFVETCVICGSEVDKESDFCYGCNEYICYKHKFDELDPKHNYWEHDTNNEESD